MCTYFRAVGLHNTGKGLGMGWGVSLVGKTQGIGKVVKFAYPDIIRIILKSNLSAKIPLLYPR